MSTKWHSRFMRIAAEVATWSKDPSTKVGAVLVKENRIISTGYNGLRKGIDDELVEGNRPFKIKNTIHAEHNAIEHATIDTDGSVLYITHLPCSICTDKIVDAGIAVVYVKKGQSDDRFKDEWNCSENLDVLKAKAIPVIEIGEDEVVGFTNTYVDDSYWDGRLVTVLGR